MNVEIIHLVFEWLQLLRRSPTCSSRRTLILLQLLSTHVVHDFSSSEASVDIMTFHGLERGKVLSNQMIGNWALVHSPVNHHLEEDHLNMPNPLESLHNDKSR